MNDVAANLTTLPRNKLTKLTMKHFLTIFLLFGTLAFCYGQGKTSLGAEVGVPTGSDTDGIGTGFGAWVRHEKGINKKFTWNVSLGCATGFDRG